MLRLRSKDKRKWMLFAYLLKEELENEINLFLMSTDDERNNLLLNSSSEV
jgi:hypothetical protein